METPIQTIMSIDSKRLCSPESVGSYGQDPRKFKSISDINPKTKQAGERTSKLSGAIPNYADYTILSILYLCLECPNNTSIHSQGRYGSKPLVVVPRS